jgi:hypothetical protein
MILMTPAGTESAFFYNAKKVIVNNKVCNKTQLYFYLLPNEAKCNTKLIGHPNL